MTDALTDFDAGRLIDMRGGCLCSLGHAPCGACSDPVTTEEFEALGFVIGRTEQTLRPILPPEVWHHDTDADYMQAVRDMCRGNG